MRAWFVALGRDERVVVVVTGLTLLGAFAVALTPFSTGDGISCGPAIIEWAQAPGGAGTPAALDVPVAAPCVEDARRRLLGAAVWAVLAPIFGSVALTMVREAAADRS
jgi:hypothetical protein